MMCEHEIKYYSFDGFGFPIEGNCELCNKKFDGEAKEIKSDFVQVERRDLDDLVGVFMRVSDWGNPDFKFDKLKSFIDKYLKKG